MLCWYFGSTSKYHGVVCRSRFFIEAEKGQGLLSNPEPVGEDAFEGFGHVRQAGPAVSPSSPVMRSPQGPWGPPHAEGSHSVAVSNMTSRPCQDEQVTTTPPV